MNFKQVRRSLHLSQIQLAVLLGIPVANIKNWEQSHRNPLPAAVALYRIIEEKNQNVLDHMVALAARKKYSEIEDVRAFLALAEKVLQNKLLRAALQMTLLETNSQWTPQQMGFRVTRLPR